MKYVKSSLIMFLLLILILAGCGGNTNTGSESSESSSSGDSGSAATENENANFVFIDAEKFPESRKLAKVDNLPTFAAFKAGDLVGQTQTNKADVLKTFIDEITNN